MTALAVKLLACCDWFLNRPRLIKEANNPVIPLGIQYNGDGGRILEPTILLDGSIYKAWYSGIAMNGGGLNQNWRIFYATSNNGVFWTKRGEVMEEAWEPDVIKVESTYYMAYVTDSSYNVRLASSPDGLVWTDHGEIVDLSDSIWSDTGPREGCLYYETGVYYCYYVDTDAGDGKYKVGLSICSGDPTDPDNWICEADPVFEPDITSPRWNEGGDTESPCVRKYEDLVRPYVMSFIGYQTMLSQKQWRVGLAYANSPGGPWTEIDHNPILEASVSGEWDDGITAECSHFQISDMFYLYYSGGRVDGHNQIGLANIKMSQLERLMAS